MPIRESVTPVTAANMRRATKVGGTRWRTPVQRCLARHADAGEVRDMQVGSLKHCTLQRREAQVGTGKARVNQGRFPKLAWLSFASTSSARRRFTWSSLALTWLAPAMRTFCISAWRRSASERFARDKSMSCSCVCCSTEPRRVSSRNTLTEHLGLGRRPGWPVFRRGSRRSGRIRPPAAVAPRRVRPRLRHDRRPIHRRRFRPLPPRQTAPRRLVDQVIDHRDGRLVKEVGGGNVNDLRLLDGHDHAHPVLPFWP